MLIRSFYFFKITSIRSTLHVVNLLGHWLNHEKPSCFVNFSAERLNINNQTQLYRFFLSTESVRADKWFFALQFDAPVLSVTAARFDNTTLSADALYVHTGSEQVIGLYSDYSLDPMTEVVMDVVISFPADYSTLCIEVANCSRCSRD